MIEMFEQYGPQAKRLEELTKLKPIQIRSELMDAGRPIEVCPFTGYGVVVGIRLFHGPREIVITRIDSFPSSPVLGPVDAAAYAVENPLPPLEPSLHPSQYRGDPLRFIAVEWGIVGRTHPLLITAKPWEDHASVWPRLEGYLVIDPRGHL